MLLIVLYILRAELNGCRLVILRGTKSSTQLLYRREITKERYLLTCFNTFMLSLFII